MTVRLYHPDTGGEFDARESAVPYYAGSGWRVKADWAAEQAARDTPAVTAPVTTSKTAGKAAEVAET